MNPTSFTLFPLTFLKLITRLLNWKMSHDTISLEWRLSDGIFVIFKKKTNIR